MIFRLFEEAAPSGNAAPEEAVFTWDSVLQTVFDWCKTTGIRLIIALLIMFISFKVINFIGKRIVKKNKEKGKIDHTLIKTLVYFGKVALKIVITICLIGYLGIDTSGLTALVASLGVCIGLAVNGTLSNLAGGIMIIISRPFKDGDYIEALGYAGTVEDIRIIYTKIITVDNKVVYLQNGALSTSTIVNYNEKGLRRVDIDFAIDYSADLEKAKSIIVEYGNSHDKVLKDPAPFARVVSATDSAIKVQSRMWVKADDYWDVFFDCNENIKSKFDEAGIKIPYNQLDVHVKND